MASGRIGQSYALRHQRRVDIGDPIRFLILGMIRRAVLDAAGLDCAPKEDVASARAFLNSDDYRELCNWLGIRPSLARRVQVHSNGETSR